MFTQPTTDDLPDSIDLEITDLDRDDEDVLVEYSADYWDLDKEADDFMEKMEDGNLAEVRHIIDTMEADNAVPAQFGGRGPSVLGVARFYYHSDPVDETYDLDWNDIEDDWLMAWLFNDDPLATMTDATVVKRYLSQDHDADPPSLVNVPEDASVPIEIDSDHKPEWVNKYSSWLSHRRNVESLDSPTRDEKLNFIADAMEEEFEFMTLDTEAASVKDRTLYVYDEDRGVYTTEGTSVVESQLRQWFGELPTHQWKEVINRLKAIPSTDPDALNAREHDDRLRCVRNGVLNLDTGELLEDSPDYLFTEYLPQEFDPDADPEQVEETLRGLVETEEEYQTLLEWLGFILAPDYALHRFLIMTGKGGNGKGVFMKLISAFVGDDNVSGVTLEKMQASETFGLSPLEHSMVNIDGDATGGRFYGSALTTLKKASGGDQITIRKMHQEPYFVRNTSKMMFSANEPPRIIDDGDSIPRRLLWVEFPYSFAENPDPENETEKQKLVDIEYAAGVATEAGIDEAHHRVERFVESIPDLLSWLEENGRVYPWRKTTDVWTVYATEILLQRTRADAVAGMYDQFFTRFDSPEALYNVPEDDVREVVRTLGFVNHRVRSLREAATMICEEYGGEVPQTLDELKRPWRVGDYTARACQIFARGESLALVDANFARVFERVFDYDMPQQPHKSKEVYRVLDALVPDNPEVARAYNFAILDLGALICTPEEPEFERCPLSQSCTYYLTSV